MAPITVSSDEAAIILEALEALVDQLAITQDWGTEEEKQEAANEGDRALLLRQRLVAHFG